MFAFLAFLVLLLAVVIARQHEPGETLSLLVQIGGHLPCIACTTLLTLHSALSAWGSVSSLLHRVRRLSLRGRPGRGRYLYPQGTPSDKRRTTRASLTSGAFPSHREASSRVRCAAFAAARDGAPPWVTLLLLLHAPAAMLLHAVSRLMNGSHLPSPLAWLLGPDSSLRPWSRADAFASNLFHRAIFTALPPLLAFLGYNEEEIYVEMMVWLESRKALQPKPGWFRRHALLLLRALCLILLIVSVANIQGATMALLGYYALRRAIPKMLSFATITHRATMPQLPLALRVSLVTCSLLGLLSIFGVNFFKVSPASPPTVPRKRKRKRKTKTKVRNLPPAFKPDTSRDVPIFSDDARGDTLTDALYSRALLSAKAKKKTKKVPPSPRPMARTSTNFVSRLSALAVWFVIDSGCTFHSHPHQSDLVNLRPSSQFTVAADGSRHRVTCVGDLPIICRDRQGKMRRALIKDVRCIPTFEETLISVDQLWENSRVETKFGATKAICLPTVAGHCSMELPFSRHEGLFQWAVIPAAQLRSGANETIRMPSFSMMSSIHRARTTSHVQALPADAAAAALHRRLHVNHEYLRRLPDFTSDAPKSLKKAGEHSCEHCTEANAAHVPHSGKRYKPSRVGRLIHGDIVGPFKRSHQQGYQYMLVLVDDHSRTLAVRLLQKKSEALAGVRNFVAELNSSLSKHTSEDKRARVGTLHTDNAGEFLSREFSEFLDAELIDRSLCPPHVHQLNGTAERAIRSIMSQVRSNLVASGAPISFWSYAALHSVEVLNRVRGPPGNKKSSYEILNGTRPTVMDILPFGCRAYAVKPSASIRKTNIEPHAWVGINLGLEASTPGAYNVWIPDVGRIVATTEVYFDEGLMPWRPKGDQRIGEAMPSAPPRPHSPAIAPPSLSGSASKPPSGPSPSVPASAGAPAASLPESYDRAVLGEHAKARASRRVLLLFSGPHRRPDGIAAFLKQLGYEAVLVDADPEHGGGSDEDILEDSVFNKLLDRVKSGEFLAIFAAPPCSTFSISRFIEADGGGAPPVRSRSHIRGLPDVPAKHRKELLMANSIVARTVMLLAAAQLVGTQWAIENPADRGDPAKHRLWLHDQHGPLWLMPEVIALKKTCLASSATFPMCSFGAPWQKHTTLLYTPGFEAWFSHLDQLECTHKSHDQPAGGKDENGHWLSARASAYPANFNYYVARAVRSLSSPTALPSPLVPRTEALGEDTIEERAKEVKASTPRAPPAFKKDKPILGGSTPPPKEEPSPSLDDARTLDFSDAVVNSAIETTSTKENIKPRKVHFERALGPLPVHGQAARQRNPPDRFVPAHPRRSPSSFRALHAKAAAADPRTRKEALQQDEDGWLASERKELANHLRNGTFEIQDRSQLPAGRKLVRWTWVYKWKRDGTQKSRLCVQGCSMVPGVDFDQTFCATMRSTSLRLLGALAAKLGLRMRRWDFTAAYLQGNLEEGEVIYCSMPPGYDVKGKDGQSRICKIVKPCYGMSQAGRRWQRALFPWLKDWRDCSLKQTYGDSCVFYCCQETDTPQGKRSEWLIVGAYVDDLLVLHCHDDEFSLYHRFTTDLQSRWAVEDEGDVSDLLGIDISVENSHVCLRQENYITKLASEFFPDGAPPSLGKTSTPCLPDLPQLVLEAVDSKEDVNLGLQKQYQSLVGALLYCATNTRPDVAYAVGMLCRAMSRPSPELLLAAQRVLAYLIRSKHVGLRYAASERPLFGMTDSDWSTRHSTSGWVFMLSSAAISWGSKRQVSIALSSCEAEIMAASEAAKEAVYLKRFAEELGAAHSDDPLELFEDNKGARDLAYNPEHHSRTKHIDRRHFYIRELVELGELVVPYVKTDDNMADFFTKALPAKRFYAMRNKIMNVPVHASSDNACDD